MTRITEISRPKHRRGERGVVLIFVAISLLVLAAFLALAIDVGFMYSAKASLQSSIDSAALAGASGLVISPAEARARAMDYAAKNPVFGQQVVLQAGDIELGSWNKNTHEFDPLDEDHEDLANSIRVTGNLTGDRGSAVPLFFARVLMRDEADVRAQSVATAGQEIAWDIVILQDITGSFTEELDTAIQADRGLLGCVADHAAEHSRVGFAVHTGWGKALTPLWSIEDGYADLSIIIDGVDSCGPSGTLPCSGTDQAAGMEAALDIFDNSPPNPYPHTHKAIVLVSDGQPNADSQKGSHPHLDNNQLADLALDYADIASDAGIDVFTVFYDQADDDDAADFLASMTRGIGTFQRTPDPDDLGLLLSEVCSALVPSTRLVE